MTGQRGTRGFCSDHREHLENHYHRTHFVKASSVHLHGHKPLHLNLRAKISSANGSNGPPAGMATNDATARVPANLRPVLERLDRG